MCNKESSQHVRTVRRSVATARFAFVVSLLISVQSIQAHDLPAHDAMTAATQNHKVLIENESVRVLETRIRPGERTAVHSHPWPAAMYVVSFSDFVRYDPAAKVLADSRTMSSKPQAGAALWSPMVAWTMYPEASLKVMKGAPKVYESSQLGRRHFCGNCGTGLFY